MSKRATVIGWVAAWSTVIAVKPFLPPTRCADGWPSPSIGMQGACSWHGGVAVGGAIPVLLAMATAFVLAALIVTGIEHAVTTIKAHRRAWEIIWPLTITALLFALSPPSTGNDHETACNGARGALYLALVVLAGCAIIGFWHGPLVGLSFAVGGLVLLGIAISEAKFSPRAR